MSELAQAILEANAQAITFGRAWGIAYHNASGWQSYDLTRGTSGSPEFICRGSGKMPLALTEIASKALLSLIDASIDALGRALATERSAQSVSQHST